MLRVMAQRRCTWHGHSTASIPLSSPQHHLQDLSVHREIGITRCEVRSDSALDFHDEHMLDLVANDIDHHDDEELDLIAKQDMSMTQQRSLILHEYSSLLEGKLQNL